MRFSYLLVLLLGACSWFSTHNFKKNPIIEPVEGLKVHSYTHNKSGLQLYMVERPGINMLSFVTAYRVGSMHEQKGKTGLAHLFEHMMFRKTKNFPDPKLTLNQWGGRVNAYTSFDLTLYYENVPKHLLKEVISFEADRMRNLEIDQDVYNTERGAVISERKSRYEDSPIGTLYWELFDTFYDKHPYKTLPIGYQKDLDLSTLGDAQDFYRKFYAPNRAVVVVVGDINVSKTLVAMEKSFGSFEKQEWKKPEIPQEKPRSKLRKKVFQKRSQNAILADARMGFPFKDRENVAVEMLLCNLISNSSHGYLKFKLKDTGIAQSFFSTCGGNVDPDISAIIVTANPGVSLAKLESSYDKVMKNFVNWLDEKKLEKLKLYFISSKWSVMRSPSSLAEDIGSSVVTTDDPVYSFDLMEKINKVTLNQVIQRYRNWNKRHPTRVALKPKK